MEKTTETLDKLYLEWSQFTSARTAREQDMFGALTAALARIGSGNFSLVEDAIRVGLNAYMDRS